MVGRSRAAHPTGKVNQETKGEFDHRLHEARLGMGHQDARPRGSGHVDVPDVDGAPHDGTEPRQAFEDDGRHGRRTIGNDEVDAARHPDHALRIERRLALVQHDLDQLLQPREGAGPIVLPPGERGVGQEKLVHAAELTPAAEKEPSRRSE